MNLFTKRTLTKLLASLALLLVWELAKAQFGNNRWVFAQTAGIEFDHTSQIPKIANQGNRPNYNTEGCAIANDPLTGQLLFYTDGTTVYNRNHEVMANGSDIGGKNNNSPAQQAAIAAFPDCSGKLFYIFVTTASHNYNPPSEGDLSYSVVDMTANSGTGAVMSKNRVIRTDADEGMIVIANTDMNKQWLITHSPNSDKWISIPITDEPLSLEDTTTHHTFMLPLPDHSKGKILGSTFGLSHSKVAKKIAFGTAVPTKRVITITVNDTTGELSNLAYIDTNALNPLGEAITSQVIGIEWSPDGTKLYASTMNSVMLYQYDLLANNSRVPLYANITAAQGGTMKLGPDGKIYHRVNIADPDISIIEYPNLAGEACYYHKKALTGLTDVSYYNFPVHTDYVRYEPKINADPEIILCKGDSITLTIDKDAGTAWYWSNGETGRNLTVKTSGDYSCQVTYPNGCQVSTPIVKVHVNNPPVVFAGEDRTIYCNVNADLKATASGGSPPYTFRWAGNPDAGAEYKNVGAGTYIVTVTDRKGCTDTDTVIVDYLNSTLELELTGPSVVCTGNTATINAIAKGGVGYLAYLWSTGETTPSITAKVTADSTFWVKVTDSLGCNLTRFLSIKANPLAQAQFEYQKNELMVIFFGTDDREITSWEWDFDDRTPRVYTQNPVHTFPQTGTFDVQLIVSNECSYDTIVYPLLVDSTYGGGSTGIKEKMEHEQQHAITIYPNPFSGQLTITLNAVKQEHLIVTLSDVTGRTLYQSERILPPGIQTLWFDSQPLLQGLYFLTIKEDKIIHTFRLSAQ